jgi:hypothetical protein
MEDIITVQVEVHSRGAVFATSGRNYSIIQEIELSAMDCSHNAKFVIVITIVSTAQKNIVTMFNIGQLNECANG